MDDQATGLTVNGYAAEKRKSTGEKKPAGRQARQYAGTKERR